MVKQLKSTKAKLETELSNKQHEEEDLREDLRKTRLEKRKASSRNITLDERVKKLTADKKELNASLIRMNDIILKLKQHITDFDEDIKYREAKRADLSIRLPRPGLYKMHHYRIDQKFSNSYSVWKLLGKPIVPDDRQLDIIKGKMGLELYEPEKRINLDSREFTIPLELPHHSVSLLVFELVE